jgi:hypothetical protein
VAGHNFCARERISGDRDLKAEKCSDPAVVFQYFTIVLLSSPSVSSEQGIKSILLIIKISYFTMRRTKLLASARGADTSEQNQAFTLKS